MSATSTWGDLPVRGDRTHEPDLNREVSWCLHASELLGRLLEYAVAVFPTFGHTVSAVRFTFATGIAMPSIPFTHSASHAVATPARLLPRGGDLLRVGSRRWFLQTGLSSIAGLTLADTLRARALQPRSTSQKAVILFWLSGGPSQIDTWDPKPDAPAEIRGPYSTIPTSVPGVRFCEHLPLAGETGTS